MMPIGNLSPASLPASRLFALQAGAPVAQAQPAQPAAIQASAAPTAASIQFGAFVSGLISVATLLLAGLFNIVQRAAVALAAPAPGAPAVPTPAPVSPALPAPLAPSAPSALPAAPVSGAVSFRDAYAQATAGQPFQLGAATYTFDDFAPNPNGGNGLFMMNKVTGMAGAGIDRTVIEMNPGTSTYASTIPTTPFASNSLALIRVNGGSPNLHDFTVRGTQQGHMYNGLMVNYATNAQVAKVKVTGVPGNDGIPPGETFGVADYRTEGSVYRDLEVDGQGIGGSCFGGNRSSDLTIDRGNFHGSGSAAGVALWRGHNATLIDCVATNNKVRGFNFESMSGTVNLVRPVMHNNGTDLGIVSDDSSAVFNIIDPVFDGPKLRVHMGPVYMGKPNLQRREDVHVIINGVDRTNDVLQWV